MTAQRDALAEVMHQAHYRKTCLGGTSVQEGAGCLETRMLADAVLAHLRPPREDVTPSGVAALRMAADNMPLGRPGQPWEGAAHWLHRRATAIEQHLLSARKTSDHDTSEETR